MSATGRPFSRWVSITFWKYSGAGFGFPNNSQGLHSNNPYARYNCSSGSQRMGHGTENLSLYQAARSGSPWPMMATFAPASTNRPYSSVSRSALPTPHPQPKCLQKIKSAGRYFQNSLRDRSVPEESHTRKSGAGSPTWRGGEFHLGRVGPFCQFANQRCSAARNSSCRFSTDPHRHHDSSSYLIVPRMDDLCYSKCEGVRAATED